MINAVLTAVKKLLGGRAVNSVTASYGALPFVLAHGTGTAGYDEIFIFGGIGLIVVALIFLSWRAGRRRNQQQRRRRRRR